MLAYRNCFGVGGEEAQDVGDWFQRTVCSPERTGSEMGVAQTNCWGSQSQAKQAPTSNVRGAKDDEEARNEGEQGQGDEGEKRVKLKKMLAWVATSSKEGKLEDEDMTVYLQRAIIEGKLLFMGWRLGLL